MKRDGFTENIIKREDIFNICNEESFVKLNQMQTLYGDFLIGWLRS